MKTRIVHTRIWQDNFILNINSNAKLLFVYVITNERIGLTGAYECPDQIIQLETGLNKNQLTQAKTDLSKKIFFQNGWIAIKNARKYNDYSKSKSHKEAYERELSFVPENIKKFVLVGDYCPTSPRLDKIQKPKIRNKNIKIIKELISKEEREKVINYFIEKGATKEIIEQEITKFISYWTEKNHTGTKERWQLQKTFEVKKRLATWFNNVDKFNGRSNAKRGISI